MPCRMALPEKCAKHRARRPLSALSGTYTYIIYTYVAVCAKYVQFFMGTQIEANVGGVFWYVCVFGIVREIGSRLGVRAIYLSSCALRRGARACLRARGVVGNYDAVNVRRLCDRN